MAKKTHGLGRGLDSLFAGTEDWGTSIQEIPVGELDPNPDQPRRTFSPESISQLADSIRERYGIDAEPDTPGWELMEMAGRKRGYLISGGEVNLERMCKVLIDEFRSGKLGKFTLEQPEEDV